jgi:hypothetical protein
MASGGSDCDIAEAWHHGGEIVLAVEAVLEFGEVAGYMPSRMARLSGISANATEARVE